MNARLTLEKESTINLLKCQTLELILDCQLYLTQVLENFLSAIAPHGIIINAGNTIKSKDWALRKFGRQTAIPGYHSQIAYLSRLAAKIPDMTMTNSENTNPQKGFSTYRGNSLINMNNAKISPVVRNKFWCSTLEINATPTKRMDHFKNLIKICFMLLIDPIQEYKNLLLPSTSNNYFSDDYLWNCHELRLNDRLPNGWR